MHTIVLLNFEPVSCIWIRRFRCNCCNRLRSFFACTGNGWMLSAKNKAFKVNFCTRQATHMHMVTCSNRSVMQCSLLQLGMNAEWQIIAA